MGDAMSGGEDESVGDDGAAATELRIRLSSVVRDQRHPRVLEDAGLVATDHPCLSERSASLMIQ